MLLELGAAVGLGLSVAITAYMLVSFGVMLRHTAPRPVGALLVEMARELFWVALLQPIAPLWYLVGRRMGRGTGGVPVVFVHGYMQNRVDFVWIARRLRKEPVGPMFGFNYPWMLDLAACTRRLGRFVERVCRETGAERVDLVCHSMGGVLATELTRDAGHRVRRCVTIASPHAGITWRGPLLGSGVVELRRGSAYLEAAALRPVAVPTLSVHSTHDNVVHPPMSSTLAHRGGEDLVVAGRGHFAILFAPATCDAVAQFLRADG